MSYSEEQLDNIAIIGMAGKFPGANNIQEFWNNLIEGKECFTNFSDEELKESGLNDMLINDPNYVKTKGILGNADQFDAELFGFSPRVAELTDPQHRLFLECSWEAMEDAACNPENYKGRIGVYAGQSMNTYWIHNVADHIDLTSSPESLQAAIGNDKDSLTTEVSYRLGLTGPSVNVQSSSSTSLVAIHTACQALLSYECDVALSGGVSIHFPEKAGYLYQEGGTTSKDGKCRAFDANATGFVSGDGVGVVILKRLQDAIEDNDRIYAVIKGSAINNDGSSKMSYMAPSVLGQRDAIAMAHAIANVSPDSISYVETHGTGTKIGDPIEITALTEAFNMGSSNTLKKKSCALGSVKTNIGHLDTAAGVVGLIKTALCLFNKQIPPTLNFQTPNPEIDFDNSPFFVNTALLPWDTNHIRRAGVSSFGMGGTNAHIVLEEAPNKPAREIETINFPELVTLSANTKISLNNLANKLFTSLESEEFKNVKAVLDIAYTLNTGRKDLRHRVAFTAKDKDQLINKLKLISTNQADTSYSDSEHPLVFMFTGQGSQYVNMAKDLYENEPYFKRQLENCFELFLPYIGINLRDVFYPSFEEKSEASDLLKNTAITQPALFSIEFSLAKLLLYWGMEPDAMIGHSIGEYVAATLAGVFKLEDAIKIVSMRGKIISQLERGKMLSVHACEQDILPYLNGGASIAAVNSDNSIVVSGSDSDIEKVYEVLKSKGFVCTQLYTSHGFHSEMMVPAIEPFNSIVSECKLSKPTIPFISNVSGTWITEREAMSSDYWANHIRKPVLFNNGIKQLLKEPNYLFIEVGPGNTLVSLLNQNSSKQDSHKTVNLLRHPKLNVSDHDYLIEAMGKIWSVGARVEWNKYYADRSILPNKLSLPTYPFERNRYWLDPISKEKHVINDTVVKQDVRDMLYAPVWQEAPIYNKKILYNPKVTNYIVFIEEDLLQNAEVYFKENNLNKVFITKGDSYKKVNPDIYVIDPDCYQDYERVFDELKVSSDICWNIIHLWNIETQKENKDGYDLFKLQQRNGYNSLLHLIQVLEKINLKEDVSMKLQTVSGELMDIYGTEALLPESSTVLPLGKVITQEFPSISSLHVDIEMKSLSTKRGLFLTFGQLIEEFNIQSHNNSLIGYRNNKRWVINYRKIQFDYKNESITDKSVYLIVGGLGDIGYGLAYEIAKDPSAKVILTGRSSISNINFNKKVERLNKLKNEYGDRVNYYQADANDHTRMHEVIQFIHENHGDIDVVVYSVGDIDEELFKPLKDLNHKYRDIHFEAKVKPLYVLEELINTISPKFCVLNSSISSILGGIRYGSYAAANQFMDQLVKKKNKESKHTRWISINWDAWKTNSNPQNNQYADLLKLAIEPSEGHRLLQMVLEIDSIDQVIISTTDLDNRINNWNKVADEIIKDQKKVNLHPRPSIHTTYKHPTNEIERQMVDIWREMLGIDKVGIDDNFFDLGGNSLTGIRLISKINEEFKTSLSSVTLYEGPTVQKIANIIAPSDMEEIGIDFKKSSSVNRGEKRRLKRSGR